MMSNHHILIDAWCRGLLMNDFFEIYGALGEGRPANLPTPPRYRDYIAWLQRQDLEQSRRWWSESLRGFERPTLVPSDRPFLREHAGESGGMIVGDRYTRLDAADGRAPARTGAALPAHRQHLRPGRLGADPAPLQRRARRALRRHRGRAPGGHAGNAAHRRPVHQQHPIARADAGRRPALHGARMAEPAVRAQPGVARARAPAPGSHPGKQRAAQGPAAVRQPVRVRERSGGSLGAGPRAEPERQFRLRAYPHQLPVDRGLLSG